MKLFKDFKLSNELQQSISKLGFETPTLIQERSIPYIISGRDVIGESATGSGKTLAFGCGIVEHTFHGKGVQALILAPTRELTGQVRTMINQISHHKLLNIISVYGGVSIEPQIRDLARADVVVATPGRLLDHLQRKTVNLSNVKLLVLDEADRMLDMGFIDDVRKIIQLCPAKRQTLFFSATMSSEIKGLTEKYMVNPVRVSAEKMVDPDKLKQVYYDIPKNMKLSLLIHLLRQEVSGLVMVFCNTRRTTDVVVANLRANRFDAIAIHGGFSQNKRTNTLSLFNKGKVGVLVCTDVAARGLDIENVSHIYNYDIPKDPKDHVHRIGRTARAGKDGKVINLLCEYDHDNFSRILQAYRSFKIEKIERGYIAKVDFVNDISPRRGPQRYPKRDFARSSGRRPTHGRRHSGWGRHS